jgi:NitT/TauT family transport system substrate-binding protein
MKRVEESRLPTNRPHMRWMLNAVLESIFPDGDGNWQAGRLSLEAYTKAGAMLKARGALKTLPTYEEFSMDEEALGNVEP